jgi:hypothetical protein
MDEPYFEIRPEIAEWMKDIFIVCPTGCQPWADAPWLEFLCIFDMKSSYDGKLLQYLKATPPKVKVTEEEMHQILAYCLLTRDEQLWPNRLYSYNPEHRTLTLRQTEGSTIYRITGICSNTEAYLLEWPD